MVSTRGIGIIRSAFRFAGMLNPNLAGWAAFHLFCRPPRLTQSSEAERKLSSRAEQRLAKADALDVAYDDGTIRAYRFTPAKPTDKPPVVLIHGWTGRAAFMLGFAGPLLSMGFPVLAIDLPGHGASSGRTLHLPKALCAVEALHKQTGPWHGIIAHSFGGAVASAAASGFVPAYARIPLKRLVLVATPHSLTKIFHDFGNFIGLNTSAQAALDQKVLALAGRPLADFEGDAMLASAQVPTLLLHAPDDKEVPFAGAEHMAEAGTHVRLQSLPGLGHRRILYAPDTIKAATGFMADEDEQIAIAV